MPTRAPVFTIGHSNRSLDEFLAILGDAGVRMIVDVRHIPKSRANPQYHIDRLPASLAQNAIGYCRIEELGGFRRKSELPAEINALWRNRSFHNYADYALTAEFAEGLDRLIELSREQPTAIMCSEAVWWRCHQRIIADHLLARGLPVIHLMGAGRMQGASITPGAHIDAERVTYPAAGA